MAGIVLRVRLVSGNQIDLTYEEPGTPDVDGVTEHVITTLAKADGMLQCLHGDRLVALYARGVAAVEVAPRGAVL